MHTYKHTYIYGSMSSINVLLTSLINKIRNYAISEKSIKIRNRIHAFSSVNLHDNGCVHK